MDEWADEKGDLGSVYGKQWRHWHGIHGEVDQITKLIRDIVTVINNPHASEARRMLLVNYNPGDLPPKAPAGCHTMSQWNVNNDEKTLNCHLYCRSIDSFLGLPFNIACYGLLVESISYLTGLKAGELIISFGDVHIYSNHFDQVDQQLLRSPGPLPEIVVNSVGNNFVNVNSTIIGYTHQGVIKGEVAV